jgi:hypothetical protein
MVSNPLGGRLGWDQLGGDNVDADVAGRLVTRYTRAGI